MSVVLVGVSHHTAAVDVRERFTVPGERAATLDEALAKLPGISEAAIIATCNRTELIAVAHDPDEARDALARFMLHEIGDGEGADALYVQRDREAVLHVLRVCSSLDSMVVGEAQILGQMKGAYRAAVEAASCGPVLNRLFQIAFHTAKRVRSETGLGAGSISVARVGVQLASELFESFEGKRVLLVGAGEMATSALYGFRDAGATGLVVLNRTLARARSLAEAIGGRADTLDALGGEIAAADVVLVSVGADRPVVGRAEVEPAIKARAGRPLLLIDLALPRNVDPAVDDLPEVYRYDLDGLDAVAARGRAQRASSVGPAEAIVAQQGDRFEQWQAGLDAVPTIRALLDRVEQIGREEVQRTFAGLAEADRPADEALDRMVTAIASKLLHPALRVIRAEAEEKSAPYYTDAVRRIFGLEEEEE